MSNGFLDRVNLSTVAINGISGLGVALMALYAPLEKLNLPQPYTSYVLGFIAAVFVFIVLRAAILAVPLRSILRDPDAFILRRELPEHLVGRIDDIDRLEQKLNESLLLFVEGESGVGKSALLRAGLAPKLRTGHRYLPVYVESLAGQDWADGPWRAVLPAFRAALDDKAPPPSRKPLAEAFNELLEAARKIGRMPVLIIDQFDDYQLRHSTLFLRDGTWLRAAELTSENTFWAALHAALDGSRLQLVIATRNDMASGLEAARFIEPLRYRVEKVAPQYLRDLIERLSRIASGASGAIDAPLATWPNLRMQLLDDLASGGAILPQQLKVALLGLQGLPRQQLTTEAYMAVGRVRGLEANWIEMQIERAARKGKLSTSGILRLLVALCEPDAAAKTRDLSLPALCEVAGLEDHVAVETALTALEEGEVVRRLARVDLNESLWRLDHDYIAGVVDLAHRRANCWELTLAEGRKALAGASGMVRKWEALLPFKTQVQFFLDRVKGRFRYESGRAYAFLSLARFVPAMLAVLVVAFGYHTIQKNTKNRETAMRVSAGFDTDSELSEKEVKNLIDLSLSNTSVARDVIELMLDDSNLTENFVAHLRPMMAALYLAADGNWFALSDTAEPFAKKAMGSERIPVLYIVAMLLSQADRTPEAATLLVAAMEMNKDDVDALSRLVGILGAIGDGVPRETIGLAATRLGAAMKANKDDVRALSRLAGGLRAIGDRVPQETAGLAATLLIAAMEANMGNAASRRYFTDVLRAIRHQVPQEIANLAAERLVAAMEANKGDVKALSRLADSLDAIGDGLPQETVALVANHLVARMEANKGDAMALSLLASRLGAIGNRVPQKTAGMAATLLVAAIEADKDGRFPFSMLIDGLGAIEERVPQETVRLASNRLAAAMEAKKGDTDAIFKLASGLGAIADRLPQETVRLVANRLIAAMEANKGDTKALSKLAHALGAIADRLSQETARLVANHLIAAMEANKGDTKALSELAGGLGAIGARLPQETAGLAANRLVAAMEANKDDTNVLSLLADGLHAIGDRVPKANAQSLAGRLDTLLPRCDISAKCHVARIALQSVLSKERAIQLVFLAGRDPLNIDNAKEIVGRLGRLTGSDLEDKEDWKAAEAWLRKHRTAIGVDDASIREELRDLMRERKAIPGAKIPVEE